MTATRCAGRSPRPRVSSLACCSARMVLPLPAPPRISTRFSSRVTRSSVACSWVSRSASAARSSATAVTSREVGIGSVEDLRDQLDVVVRRGGLSVREAAGVLRDATGQRVLVAPVVQRPARQVGRVEGVGEVGERGGHAVRPRDAAAAGPAVVALDVLAQGVLRGARLRDRVDAGVAAVALEHPAVVPPDAAALDLEDEHADLGHEDDEVGLVVLVLVGEPEVGQEHVVVAEGVAQALPHRALGLGREGRVLRDQPWHGADPATRGRPAPGILTSRPRRRA